MRGVPGAAAVVPRSTPTTPRAVEGDHYLAGRSLAQKAAAEDAIEEPNGIWSAGPIRRPWYWVCTRISKPSSGTFPRWPARGKLDEGALGELLGGELDVFAAG